MVDYMISGMRRFRCNVRGHLNDGINLIRSDNSKNETKIYGCGISVIGRLQDIRDEKSSLLKGSPTIFPIFTQL